MAALVTRLRIPLLLVGVAWCVAGRQNSYAKELTQPTVQAFAHYVQLTEARIQNEGSDPRQYLYSYSLPLSGQVKTGHTWSLQNRPYGPGLRCCTLPFAFLTSLISEISKWRAISSSKLEKISFTGPWGHFLEVSHSSGRAFRLVFDAMLIPLATWSSNSADRI